MGDFSGPITGCFKIVVVIGIIIFSIITLAAYKGGQYQQEKTNKELYQKAKEDALKEIKVKLDSIKNSKK